MSETAVETPLEEAEIAANLEPDADLDPDDGPDETLEPAAEDESETILATAQTERELEKRQRALEREAERHEKRVRELLGDDAAGLIKCEACPPALSGYHFGPEDYPPGSSERALYEMLSSGDASMMRHPEWLETCSECNGFGQVLTGARTDHTRQLTCPICKGAGYIDTRRDSPPPLTVAANGVEPGAAAPIATPTEPNADMWGRPLFHPNFGKFPIYLTDEERASDLAEGFTVE